MRIRYKFVPGKKGGVYIMKNLEELVSLYLEQSDGGKSYTNNANLLEHGPDRIMQM